MTRPTLIRLADILATVADLRPCPDCAGGLGIHVEHTGPDAGDWTAVVVHSVPCPATGATAADYRAAHPTDNDQPTTTEAILDEANADVIACLAAMHRGDHQGAADVLASTNRALLAYPLLHLVDSLGPAAVGAEAWAEALTAWQPGQALGEGLIR